MAAREAPGWMWARVIATRSSSDSSTVRRSSTTIASCAGLRVVCIRCGRCEASPDDARPRHLRTVPGFRFNSRAKALTPLGLVRM